MNTANVGPPDPSQMPWPARVDQPQAPPQQQMPQQAPQQTPQAAPQQPNPSQIQQQLQQISETPLQPVPQAGPDQGASPVKRFLTNFFYGAGQSALQHVGLPTDYEKQQNVIQQNQRQQQLNQQAGETSSLIGLHQQQLQNEQQTYAQNQYQNQQLPIPAEVAHHFPGQVTARRADIIPMLTAGSALNQKMPMDVDDDIADILKLPRGTQVDPRMIPILSKMAALNPAAWVVTDANGVKVRVNKFNGAQEPVLDASGKPLKSNAMLAPWERAKANAAYTPAQTMDSSGNPTTVSNQALLNSGAPKMTEGQTMTLQGDKVGVDTYLGASDRVENGLRSGVMKDPVQRGLIARATEDIEKNPGAIDSIMSSYSQQGLSPQGSDMIAALRQMGEFGPVFKKFSGNGGRSSDALNATIKSNQPSSANSDATNLNLIMQDRKLALQIKQQLQRPGAYAPKARQTTAPAQQPGTPSPAAGGSFSWSQFGGQQR